MTQKKIYLVSEWGVIIDSSEGASTYDSVRDPIAEKEIISVQHNQNTKVSSLCKDLRADGRI